MSKRNTPVSKTEFNKAVEETVDVIISAIENGELDTENLALVTLREL